jgi:hypothetical protein
MIQKNTAISETVVRASGGYQFRLLNECDAPEDIRNFERFGMTTIKLWGIRYGHEHCMSFVNDLEDPTSPPFNW